MNLPSGYDVSLVAAGVAKTISAGRGTGAAASGLAPPPTGFLCVCGLLRRGRNPSHNHLRHDGLRRRR
jgi:hypothetical protein